MGTVANLIEEARYDLADYEEGLNFDDRLLYVYINRMIKLMDSQLAALGSDLVHANETIIDTVANKDYVDLTNLNHGYWDSIKEVWIGQDRKQPISYYLMEYKRQWRLNQTAEPEYWATSGQKLLWETDCDSAHTDLILRYNKKHRKRLESYTLNFTGNATNVVAAQQRILLGTHTFVTGDGPFQFSTTNTLPTGLSASTDYWLIFDPSAPTYARFATTKEKALGEKEYHSGYTMINGATYKILERTTTDFTSYGAGDNNAGTYFTCDTADISISTGDRLLKTEAVNISATGSGTHTITLQPDVMPWDGVFDDFIKEMLVMHAMSKRGENPQMAMLNMGIFKKRAMEETIRRGFVPKYYRIDY